MTTRPSELVEKIHTRMPVIVRPEDYDLWMDSKVRNPAARAGVRAVPGRGNARLAGQSARDYATEQ
jgi:putative SOS response-associated peptidase YedK